MNDTPLPRAHGVAVLSATLRALPEDFRVDEIDGFAASGSGEHLLLTIEKRGMTTAYAAKRIAQWAGVAEAAVGYAGLKDRHALTRQRFSVHLPKRIAPPIAELSLDDDGSGTALHALAHEWHGRKLPRGALAGNRFVLTLRDAEGAHDAIEERLRAIASCGVPNYFGEQRFGRGGDNVAKALAMFGGRRVRREERSHLLSAARSALFNRVLSARVADGTWNRALDGEVWMLDGSRSVFGPEAWSEALADRLSRFDIHPSAPLWGRGELRSRGAARALEEAALDDAACRLLRTGLESAGLKQERRATRLLPKEMTWCWPEPRLMRIGFALPAGSYATAVLSEIGEFANASRTEGDRSSESHAGHYQPLRCGV